MASVLTSKVLPSNSTHGMWDQFEYIFPIAPKNENKRYSGKTNLDEFLIKHGIVSRDQEDKQEREQHNTIIRTEKIAVSAYKERLANPIKRKTAEESMEWVQAKQREAEMTHAVTSTLNPADSTDPTQPIPGESTEQYISRMQSLRQLSHP